MEEAAAGQIPRPPFMQKIPGERAIILQLKTKQNAKKNCKY